MGTAKRAVIIDILSDAKGFVKGAGDADQAAARLEKNTRQLARTIVSTYAAKQVVDFAASAVKAASEDAAAQAVLRQALINTTGANDAQVASVESWIDSTQRATGVADDELRPAMTTLTAATKDVAEAQELMALSMDLARAKGIPLETAATAIAKAHSGNTTALAKLVPGLKEAGEKSLDFATATERLNEQVEGQAEAWANTDEGKLARMNIQWAEMQEQIGSALLPVMDKLLGVVSGVFEWFNSLDEGTQDLIVTIALVAGGLYVAVAAFNAVKLAVSTLGLSMQTAMPWLLGISVAVAAITAAVEIFGDSELAAEKAVKDMTKTVLASAGAVDIKTIALLDATEAAERFGEAIYAESDAALRELIVSSPLAVRAMQDLGLSMDEVIVASHDQTAAMELYARIQPKMAGSIDDGINGFTTLGLALMSATGTMEGTIEASVELAKVGDVNAIVALKASGNFALLTAEEQAVAEAALDAAATADVTADSVEGLGEETGNTFAQMVKLVDTTADLKKAFDAIIGPTLDLESSQRALFDAARATTDTLHENGATLDMWTEQGRANREVIQSQVEASLSYAEAMVKNGSTTEEATAFALEYRDALIAQLTELGLTEAEISDYLTTLGLTPENVTTSLALANKDVVKTQLEGVLKQLEGVDEGAIADIQANINDGQFAEATRKINELPGRHDVLVRLRADGAGLSLGGAVSNFSLQMNARASGGPVVAGQPYVVGELRPELFVPETNGYIVPSVPDSFGGGSGGGGSAGNTGQVIHIEATALDVPALARNVGAELAWAMKTQAA